MKSRLLAVLALILVISVVFPLSLYAQCGDGFCTPTPTPTGSATPTPGAGTPTAVPLPPTVNFPGINYGVPTPIPTFSFPAVPSPYAPQITPDPSPISPQITPLPSAITVTGIVTPNLITISLPSTPSPISPTNISLPITGTNEITLTTISTTIPISVGTVLTLSNGLTTTVFFTTTIGLITSAQGLITDVVSFTFAITEEYTAIQGTETITIVNAPPGYAPEIPRPLADVGYTFEQLAPGVDSGQRFTIASWGGFFGYIVSLPFQLIKSLWALADRLGPFSLFLAWLLIMAALVFIVEITRFLWHLLITIIDAVVKIIDVVGDWFPGT